MYSSASNSISVDAIPVSRQENHCPAISGKIDLLKEKLNAIEPNKTTHEIRYFTDFIEKNETKMRDITAISDKLLTALSVMNSIKDNIAMGEDNKANLSQLNNLTHEMEDMLNSGECKSRYERAAAEGLNTLKNEVGKGLNTLKNEVGKGLNTAKNEVGKGLNTAKNEAGKGLNTAKNEAGKALNKTGKEIKRIFKRF
ncbi:hypothetical protein [Morganella morganii]|uniref:hypothetical protein n=1 Tax=Morganella TaxID=581 RepID=UPI00370BEE1B